MEWVGVIAHHGYAVTAIVMFLAAVGLPLPMSITLLAAGAASLHGLRLEIVLPVAWAAAVAGDTLLYFGGRYTGWWLLAGMCRISMNPEQCIFSSAGYFYRRGPKTLLFAKFIPGLGPLAAPLAGSLNMRFRRFLRLDAAGVALYCCLWTIAGFIFSPFLQEIANWIERAGHTLLVIVIVLGLGYVLGIAVFTLRARRYRKIERIPAASLRERLQALTPDKVVIIADVRSHGYYDAGCSASRTRFG